MLFNLRSVARIEQNRVITPKNIYIICFVFCVTLLFGGCARGQTPTTTPLPPINTLEPLPTATVTVESDPPVAPPTAADIVEEADPTATSNMVTIDDEMTAVADLAIGSPGRYVNVAYGYRVAYPETWYTGFGNRPLLASFSNIDPGITNRETMRSTGCLFETTVSPNVYEFSLQTMMTQTPQTFANAELFNLARVEAVRLRFDNPNQPFVREIIQTVADRRIFTITGEMARTAVELCQPAWTDFVASWTWFTPDFITYRNAEQGYVISHPRRWHITQVADAGEVITSQPVEDRSLEELAQTGMVVRTAVMENPELLPLKQWVVANVEELGLTNDIAIDTLVGVRNITDWTDGTQRMTGYFQGPLGRIYTVSCTYPIDRRREFRPIANAILYSFGF